MKNVLVLITIFLLISIIFIGCNKVSNLKQDKNLLIDGIAISDWEIKIKDSEFYKNYPDYHISFSSDEFMQVVTITNYDSSNLLKLPKFQESIEYGKLYGKVNSKDNYIQIMIVKDKESYSVNIDSKTQKYSNEEGKFFLDIDKDKYIQEKIKMVESIYK